MTLLKVKTPISLSYLKLRHFLYFRIKNRKELALLLEMFSCFVHRLLPSANVRFVHDLFTRM